jgi:acetyl-CoA/propionyl-CoA carboxylase, biotin carboxylase, biotin carboxyl carrier protein
LFDRILIANRGEIAVRVERTCRALGVSTVAVFSDADAAALHVDRADAAVHLPGVASADTYLNVRALIDAALTTGAQAVHPGYGFLAESAAFARAVGDVGLTWIGPPPEAIESLGDKISARRLARDAGVPIVPGTAEPLTAADDALAFAREHGYPIAIKASGGGGGRGLKVVRSDDQLGDMFEAARREASAYFDSEDVYLERYLDAPKHLEVQLLSPTPDEALWLGVRDCSLQRRHQKLIEETPPPRFADIAPEMGSAAVALSKASGYVNAGTVEMLVDADGSFYFLEVNSRLQVEHTVTEEVFGVDLVACQLKISAGEPLGFAQGDLAPRGHAIECRINAEDPARSFAPSPGRLARVVEPSGDGVRVDAGYREGAEVPAAYDSLIAKVIVSGPTRAKAIGRMQEALTDFVIEGVATTIPAHLELLTHAEFVAGNHTTRTVEGVSFAHVDAFVVEGTQVRLWNPAMAASASAAAHGGDATAPMQGTVVTVMVESGATVAAGDPVAVLEAMKMETTVRSPGAGRVTDVRAKAGQTVKAGEVLVVIE